MFKVIGGTLKLALITCITMAIIIAVIIGGNINKLWGVYYVYLGDNAFKKHELQDAIDYYRQGLSRYPEHYSAWLNLGNLYVVYEDYFSATEAYENAIKYKKDYIRARMNLGIINAEKLGDFDEAIEQYQAVIDGKKHNFSIPFIYNNKKSNTVNTALAYYNMGNAYIKKSIYLPDFQKAEKLQLTGKAIVAYEHAAEILPNNYDIRYNLGLAYQKVGNIRQAGLNYCHAAEVAPMNYEAHYNLAILLRNMNQPVLALEELEKAAVLATGKMTSGSNYIFEILNDISHTVIATGQWEALRDAQKSEEPIVLVKGKITPNEETDVALMNNFATCKSKKLFIK